MGDTKISWAQKVWNPCTGCTPISPGCANCYAARMAKRLAGRCGYPAEGPFKVTLHSDKLEEPLRWRKSARIFVCSMGDLFHDDVPDDFISNVFAVALEAKQHTFLILTKRPERMAKYFTKNASIARWPLPNVWLGVTAENQEQADKRIPILLQIPAAVRWVSVEPMLGPVDLTKYLTETPLRPGVGLMEERIVYTPALSWVVCGGESGPGARPMHPHWARSLRDQCQESGAPFLFKQWGEWAPDPGNEPILPLMDKCKHGVWDETGSWHIGEGTFSRYENLLGHIMYRVGKKKAGRLLDGREWDEYPEAGTGEASEK